MAKRASKDYFSLGKVVSIVLAIFIVPSWILGMMTRLKEGKILAVVIRFFFGFNIIWICDLVLLCLRGRILRVL